MHKSTRDLLGYSDAAADASAAPLTGGNYGKISSSGVGVSKRSDSPNPASPVRPSTNTTTSGAGDVGNNNKRHHCPHKHKHHHNHPRTPSGAGAVGSKPRAASADARTTSALGSLVVEADHAGINKRQDESSGQQHLPRLRKFGDDQMRSSGVAQGVNSPRKSAGNNNAGDPTSGSSNATREQPQHQHQHQQDSRKKGPTVSDLWPGHWGAYDGHPERDSLDGNVPSASGHNGSKDAASAGGPGFSTDPDGAGAAQSPSSAPNPNANSGAAKAAAKYRRNNGGNNPPSGKSSKMGSNTPRKMSDAGSKFDLSFKAEKRQPKPWIWVSLSAMYGKLIVLLAFAFCLTEVMDNDVAPLHYQGIFVMYLYVASIVAIMCIYITVLVDQCPSLTNSRSSTSSASSSAIGLKAAAVDDPEAGGGGSGGTGGGGSGNGSVVSTLTRGWGGTLRRAHISRSRISRTSFYLRVGAIVFGLGTLVFTGLEIAMHTTRTERCVPEIIFAHPILQALFTFLQMHFLFVNSEVIVEKWGAAARFGLIHLVATNLSLWVRLIVYESVNDLIRGVYGGLPPPPLSPFGADVGTSSGLKHAIIQRDLEHKSMAFNGPSYDQQAGLLTDVVGSDAVATAVESCVCNAASSLLNSSHVKQVIGMYECLNNNTLGQIWSNSMSHLFPFIVEYRLKVEIHFSLIAAAVTYVMWKNVGKAKAKREIGMKSLLSGDDTLDSRKRGHFRVDCQSSSKGLFLGLLCLVGGIVVLIIFYVMKEHVDDKEQLYMMYGVTQVTIVALGAVAAFLGLFQLPRLALSGKKPMDLDRLLASTVVIGVYVFAIFGVIVGLSNIDDLSHSLLVGLQGAQILQVSLQSLVITDAARRFCSTRHQMLTKPGRQVITFLVFANATLWLMDTFMAHDAVTQGLQARFFGHLTWGVLSRVSVPLVVFYRFYSTVTLIEIWKNTYKTKTD